MRAFEFKEQGWKQIEIAKALGGTSGAVNQWLRRARDRSGLEVLHRHPAPGCMPRLAQDQLARLSGLLSEAAEHYDFNGQVWTGARVEILIKEVHDVGRSRGVRG